MNDRFKFRVWYKSIRAFQFDAEVFLSEVIDDNDVIIEQCTGLKDKNGRLIYEGDIVKLSSDRSVLCPVVWDNEETGFCVKYKKELYRFNPYKKYHLLEVIGNINENADLLENEE